MKSVKLTSVKILESLYRNFKTVIVNSSMSLQKLTNRAIFLYLNDEDFKEHIETADQLIVSGSNF